MIYTMEGSGHRPHLQEQVEVPGEAPALKITGWEKYEERCKLGKVSERILCQERVAGC